MLQNTKGDVSILEMHEIRNEHEGAAASSCSRGWLSVDLCGALGRSFLLTFVHGHMLYHAFTDCIALWYMFKLKCTPILI